jgi:hypothetical protein
MSKHSSEKLDYLEQHEKRQHPRFRSTAFLGTPIHLTPLPPFFGVPIEGQVIDLSGGGMAVLLGEALPAETKMSMELKFPSGLILACHVVARRTSACTGGFLTGIQFLDLPEKMVIQIDHMARDYNECDIRIENQVMPVCQTDCSFFSVCEKFQKRALVRSLDTTLQMKLKIVPEEPS